MRPRWPMPKNRGKRRESEAFIETLDWRRTDKGLRTMDAIGARNGEPYLEHKDKQAATPAPVAPVAELGKQVLQEFKQISGCVQNIRSAYGKGDKS